MNSDETREVQTVIGTFQMWDGRRAREVTVSYSDGTTRREIEVGVNGRYVPRYAEIEDSQ